MKKGIEEEFPEDEEDFDSIPEDLTGIFKGTTVAISEQGFSQTMVEQMNKNQLKIAQLKLKLLKNEKKEIKTYLKQNLLTKGTKEAK